MEQVPRHYAPAALAVAVAAWRAGADVRDAVSAAGYAYNVAEGLAEYVGSRFFTDDVPDLTQASQEDVSMGPQVKRARRDPVKAARVAPSVRQYVKKCMAKVLEKKYYQKSHSGVSPGTAGTFYQLGVPDIVEGTSDANRIGNQVRLLKIGLNGLIYDTAALTGNARVIIVQDLQYNGANPAVTDILASSATYSLYNHNNVIGAGGARFKILADKFYTTDWLISTASTWHHVHFSVKPNCIVQYKGSTATAADVVKNNVYALVIGFTATTTMTLNIDAEFVDE